MLDSSEFSCSSYGYSGKGEEWEEAEWEHKDKGRREMQRQGNGLMRTTYQWSHPCWPVCVLTILMRKAQWVRKRGCSP